MLTLPTTLKPPSPRFCTVSPSFNYCTNPFAIPVLTVCGNKDRQIRQRFGTRLTDFVALYNERLYYSSNFWYRFVLWIIYCVHRLLGMEFHIDIGRGIVASAIMASCYIAGALLSQLSFTEWELTRIGLFVLATSTAIANAVLMFFPLNTRWYPPLIILLTCGRLRITLKAGIPLLGIASIILECLKLHPETAVIGKKVRLGVTLVLHLITNVVFPVISIQVKRVPQSVFQDPHFMRPVDMTLDALFVEMTFLYRLPYSKILRETLEHNQGRQQARAGHSPANVNAPVIPAPAVTAVPLAHLTKTTRKPEPASALSQTPTQTAVGGSRTVENPQAPSQTAVGGSKRVENPQTPTQTAVGGSRRGANPETYQSVGTMPGTTRAVGTTSIVPRRMQPVGITQTTTVYITIL